MSVISYLKAGLPPAESALFLQNKEFIPLIISQSYTRVGGNWTGTIYTACIEPGEAAAGHRRLVVYFMPGQ